MRVYYAATSTDQPMKVSQVGIELATGCDDKNVRVYYAATSTDQPMKVFSGKY